MYATKNVYQIYRSLQFEWIYYFINLCTTVYWHTGSEQVEMYQHFSYFTNTPFITITFIYFIITYIAIVSLKASFFLTKFIIFEIRFDHPNVIVSVCLGLVAR